MHKCACPQTGWRLRDEAISRRVSDASVARPPGYRRELISAVGTWARNLLGTVALDKVCGVFGDQEALQRADLMLIPMAPTSTKGEAKPSRRSSVEIRILGGFRRAVSVCPGIISIWYQSAEDIPPPNTLSLSRAKNGLGALSHLSCCALCTKLFGSISATTGGMAG
jgi:hypothetical protein